MDQEKGEGSNGDNSSFSESDREKKNNDLWSVDLGDEAGMYMNSPLVPLLDDRDGYLVLGRSGSAHRRWRKKGLLEIGAVDEHQEGGMDLFGKKVFLDAAFPHIIFVCGKRGSGKSYTLGIFAEELMRSAIGVGVVMIDPIGIFWSLKNENRSKKEREILQRWGLKPHSFPEVKVMVPEGSVGETSSSSDGIFTISVGDMSAEDWCQVFELDRFKTQGLLVGSVIELVKNGYDSVEEGKIIHMDGKQNRFSIDDIIHCLDSSLVLTSKSGGYTPQTRRSIIARFNAADGWGIFSLEGTPIREITSSNRVTVLDVSDPRLGDEKRSLITGIIARKILSGRIHSARIEETGEIDELDPDLIPITWLLIDEAHIILPHKGQTPATEALVEYAKQGRRPGCALVLATQRPASTTDEILSQVDLLVGHNLALEDDMTALRRRVPAKLPHEFSNSDFIRAIPVGTAIMADQRTQQRSFMMRVRPRFSHHAGSSSMPKAFTEVYSKPRKKTPTTLSDSSSKGLDMDETSKVDTEKKENKVRDDELENGRVYLILDRSREKMTGVLKDIDPHSHVMVLSRMPPGEYPIPKEIGSAEGYWLSSTPGEGHIPPTSLQEISMLSGSFLGESEGRIIILDGLDYITANNGREPVKKLLEIMHEKVIMNNGILLIRADAELQDSMRELLSSESDIIIGDSKQTEADTVTESDSDIEPGQSEKNRESMIEETRGSTDDQDGSDIISDTGSDELLSDDSISSVDQQDFDSEPNTGPGPSIEKDLEGSLEREDLEWMCGVLDLSTEGNDHDLLERILHHESDQQRISDSSDSIHESERIKRIIESTHEIREENQRLKDRLEAFEKRIQDTDEGHSPARKHKGSSGMVLEWDDEVGEKTRTDFISRKEVRELEEELDSLKKELAKQYKESQKKMDPLLREIVTGLKKEKENDAVKLESIEKLVRNELDQLKKEIGKRKEGVVSETEGTDVKKIPTRRLDSKKKEDRLPPESSKKDRRKKKKVLKKGKEAIAVIPRTTMNSASDAARKTIKRSFFRGAKEEIEEITPVYLPIYRSLVNYRTSLLKGNKEGDIYIDGILGEIVSGSRSGLKRSRGLKRLIKMTDMEKRVYRALGSGKREDIQISKRSSLPVKDTRRALTSLVKKDIVSRSKMQGNISIYEISPDIEIPRKPWTREPGIEPMKVEGLEERFLDPVIKEKELKTMIKVLSDKVKSLQTDLVMYPFYIVTITGQGRTRYVAVDGLTGNIDNDLKPVLKSIMELEN